MFRFLTRPAALAAALSCFALLGPASAAHAADEELWMRAGVRYQHNKRLRLDFAQHIRFHTDPWRVDNVMPDLSGNYDVKKWLRFSLGYRYLQMRNKFERFVEWHRIYADVRVKGKSHKFKVSNRLRYQEQRSSDFSAQNRHWFRDELLFGYDTDSFWDPFVGGELYYAVAGQDGTGFQKYRLEAGIDFTVGNHQLGVEYRYENKLLDAGDPSLNILVLSYFFDL